MTLEEYKSLMKEFDISRGRLDEDSHILPDYSLLSETKEPNLINEDAGWTTQKPPITEDLSRFYPKQQAVNAGRAGGRPKGKQT
jgi:hypothetical protein